MNENKITKTHEEDERKILSKFTFEISDNNYIPFFRYKC